MNSCFPIIPQNAASLAAKVAKARLLVAITGIAFADLLMFVQLGCLLIQVQLGYRCSVRWL